MRKWGITALVMVGLLGALLWYFLAPAVSAEPPDTGRFSAGSLEHDGLTREYQVFLPETLNPAAGLLVVAHGSLQTKDSIRRFSGYGFEHLATQHGFAVVYPQGIEKNWNDCRAAASYPAKVRNIDDTGFISALLEKLRNDYDMTNAPAYLAGFSNGAHLGFKFMFEHPGVFDAVAAVSANLPAPGYSDCRTGVTATPLMLINGTDDPINPFNGGQVTLFGVGDRGQVMSSSQTAAYFAGLFAGTSLVKTQEVLNVNHHDVGVRTVWSDRNVPRVSLIEVSGGGHTVPQPGYRAPRLLGNTVSAINAPHEIWAFFRRTAAQE
ncbi:alpha/beta hydrolase family esterase [Alteromonas sp. CYL-A6]|uniref:alpha/beta hydrolase family esterase n=1 Tax=Alteromonas nitratireducens TaxID=3390813 RepID=UPI0034B1B224